MQRYMLIVSIFRRNIGNYETQKLLFQKPALMKGSSEDIEALD